MSIFSPPSPHPPPPPVYVPPVMQAPVTNADTAGDDERKARLAAVARNRAGVAGTIATGNRGVLTPANGQSAKKSLLGE